MYEEEVHLKDNISSLSIPTICHGGILVQRDLLDAETMSIIPVGYHNY